MVLDFLQLTSGLTSVAERLARMYDARRTDSRRLLADHIEPLFQDLALIHSDYCRILGAARERVATECAARDVNPLLAVRPDVGEEIAQLIARERRALRPLRIKVLATVAAWTQSARMWEADESPRLVATVCAQYLSSLVGEGPEEAESAPREAHASQTPMFNLGALVSARDVSAQRVCAEIDALEQALEARWAAVVLAYSGARTKLLK